MLAPTRTITAAPALVARGSATRTMGGHCFPRRTFLAHTPRIPVRPSAGGGAIQHQSLATQVAGPLYASQSEITNTSVFQFPPTTLFEASTREEAMSKISEYRQCLLEHGLAKIQCDFHSDIEDKSALLLDIVNSLGRADSHSATQGALWDIKNKPQGVVSQAMSGKNAVAISHTLDEFTWHIDGTFEERPTRFFAFHIIHPDKMGGGVFRVLPVKEIVDNLPDSVVDTLATKNFNIKVPPEFFKGVHELKKPLLERQPNGEVLIRYRKGLCFAQAGDMDAQHALGTLEGLLQNDDTGFAVPAEHFKENTLLLLDNRRFLHSRTSIKDPKRWLRRVRFHADSAAA